MELPQEKQKPKMGGIKPQGKVDSLMIDNEKLEQARQEGLDLQRLFLSVFDNKAGEKIIAHLDKYSHKNFPNYDNVYATYSKVGEQTLVAYIKHMIERAKKGGER